MTSLNPHLKDFWMKPARIRVLYGGRASSKSWDAAAVSLIMSRFCKLRILCCRQFQNKIKESVYSLLKIQIDRLGFSSEFEIYNNSIKHKYTGSEFLFYGISRSIDEIKSLEGIDICWIEEAHNLTEEQWLVLEPTLRKDGSQFWIIFNPRYSSDFVYKRFVKNNNEDCVKYFINYDKNPFLSDTILKVIADKKYDDYDEYQHVYLGIPKENDDGVIIKSSWIMSSIDAHKRIKGNWGDGCILGYDVADSGGDANAITIMKGSICKHIDEWKHGDNQMHSSIKKVHSYIKEYNVNYCGYDSIGVGAGVGSILNSLGFNGHFKFNAGGKVSKPEKTYKDRIQNKDFFLNLKSQAWWYVADRFRRTHMAISEGREYNINDMISIDSQCSAKLLDKLMDELSTPMVDYDNSGKVKVESKKDLLKRGIESPNIADSFIIANSRYIVGSTPIRDMI